MREIASLVSVGRLHIVAIAALGTLTFSWLFTGAWRWDLAAICALDWFIVNLLNRVVDLVEDRANAIAGTELVAKRRRAVLGIGFGALGASLALTHAIHAALTPWRLAYHGLGLAYNWPLLPGGRRLKQVYFAKNTASALGFLITCMAYPLAAIAWDAARLAPGIGWASVAWTAAFFFVFELSYEVAYDLRDAPGDARADVRTYAVVHGPRVAAGILYTLALASAGILVVGFVARILPWRIAVLAIGPLLQVVLLRRILARGITSADCIRLTWVGAALLLAYHAWVQFGLPGVGS